MKKLELLEPRQLLAGDCPQIDSNTESTSPTDPSSQDFSSALATTLDSIESTTTEAIDKLLSLSDKIDDEIDRVEKAFSGKYHSLKKLFKKLKSK